MLKVSRMKTGAFLLAILSGILFSSGVYSQVEVVKMSPPGLRIGHVTTLVLSGKNLTDDAKLIAPFPVRITSVSGNAANTQLTMDVELSEAVEAGISHFRLQTGQGISRPYSIALDRLVQIPVDQQKGSFDPTKTPAAFFGTISSSNTISVDMVPRDSGRVWIETESVRLGTKLRPVVRVLDDRGNQIAFAPPNPVMGGDLRLEVELEKDKKYRIEFGDQLRRADRNSFFRLKIGQFKFADLISPVFANERELIRSNIDRNARSRGISSLHCDTLAWKQMSFPADRDFGGTRPIMIKAKEIHFDLTDRDEIVDQELSPLPMSVSAVLNCQNGIHKYLLPVEPEQKIRFELIAERIGSTMDGVITVFDNASGRQLLQSDDFQSSSDPVAMLQIPKNVRRLRVEVKDVTGASNVEFLYGLIIEDVSDGTFEVLFDKPQVTLAPGQRQLIKLTPLRSGYNGKIYLEAAYELPGLKFVTTPILPGADQGFATVENVGNEMLNAIPIYIRADSEDKKYRTSTKSAVPFKVFRQPWLDHQVAVASIVGNEYQVTADWPQTVNMDEPVTVFSGGATPASLDITAKFKDGYDGKKEVELSALTSVIPTPTVNGKKAKPTKYAPKIASATGEIGSSRFYISAEPNTKLGQYYMCVATKLIDRRQKNSQLANTYAKPVLINVEKGIELTLAGPPVVQPGAKETLVQCKCRIEVNSKINSGIQIELRGLKLPPERAKITVKPRNGPVGISFRVPSNVSLATLSTVKISASTTLSKDQSMPLATSKEVSLFPAKQ